MKKLILIGLVILVIAGSALLLVREGEHIKAGPISTPAPIPTPTLTPTPAPTGNGTIILTGKPEPKSLDAMLGIQSPEGKEFTNADGSMKFKIEGGSVNFTVKPAYP